MDLSAFTPAQIAELKAALVSDTSGRSPLRERQLHDLRLVPTAEDPRPTFFWTAASPRNAADLTRTTLYPRLMWHSVTGAEITVTGASAEQSYTAQGYSVSAPANAVAPDPKDVLRQQLESLSPEDRKLIVQAAQKDRLAKIQEAMADLSEAELSDLAASLEPAKKQKSA